MKEGYAFHVFMLFLALSSDVMNLAGVLVNSCEERPINSYDRTRNFTLNDNGGSEV